MPQKLTHTPNEPNTLITVSIESESPHSAEILRVHLGSMNWHTNDPNGPGNQTDGSHGQADGPTAEMDAPNVLKVAEMAMLGHGDDPSMYLGAGDTKCNANTTDGVGSQSDTPNGRGDVQSVEMDSNRPANAWDSVRTARIEPEWPNLPAEAAMQHSDKPNGCRNHADRSTAHMDVQSIAHETQTAETDVKDVRKGRSTSETQNSLYTLEIESSKHSYQWREVSIDYINAHVPWNTPIKVLRTASRTFAFGQVESAGEAAAARDSEQRVGNGDGDRDGDDGDVDDMTSGGSVDSIQVEAAWLATESQHMRYSRRTQNQDLPVSPGPPIHCAECPYRPARPKR